MQILKQNYGFGLSRTIVAGKGKLEQTLCSPGLNLSQQENAADDNQ